MYVAIPVLLNDDSVGGEDVDFYMTPSLRRLNKIFEKCPHTDINKVVPLNPAIKDSSTFFYPSCMFVLDVKIEEYAMCKKILNEDNESDDDISIHAVPMAENATLKHIVPNEKASGGALGHVIYTEAS